VAFRTLLSAVGPVVEHGPREPPPARVAVSGRLESGGVRPARNIIAPAINSLTSLCEPGQPIFAGNFYVTQPTTDAGTVEQLRLGLPGKLAGQTLTETGRRFTRQTKDGRGCD
jgi:hypothetical protein